MDLKPRPPAPDPALSFDELFNANKDRLHVIVDDLKDLAVTSSERKSRLLSDSALDAGAYGFGAAVLVGVILAPFMATLCPTAVIGGAALGGGAAAAKTVSHAHRRDKMADEETVKEGLKMAAEFVELVTPMKKMLQDLSERDAVKMEARFDYLFTTVNDLTSERSTQRLLVVVEQSERTLKEIERLQETK